MGFQSLSNYVEKVYHKKNILSMNFQMIFNFFNYQLMFHNSLNYNILYKIYLLPGINIFPIVFLSRCLYFTMLPAETVRSGINTEIEFASDAAKSMP